MPLYVTPAEIDEPRRTEPDSALSDEWAYTLEAARRAAKVHEQAGPDEATL